MTNTIAAMEYAAKLDREDREKRMNTPNQPMCPNCVTPWKCNGPHIVNEELKPTLTEATDAYIAAVKQMSELAALRSKVAELDAANVGLAQESHDLQQICRDAYEVWAGSEGIPVPQTFVEEYLLQLLEQMRDEIKRGLK